VGCVLLVASGLGLATSARSADLSALGITGLPTNLLPANPANSSGKLSPGFDECPKGHSSCPPRVILRMYERWRPLSKACNHNAVFALTYLRITEAFNRIVQRHPGFFEDTPWVTHEDAVFARLYFRAFDRRRRGQSIPGSWGVAFDAAASPDQTGIGDLLLGVNAHVNRDLSYGLAAVGLVKPAGGSRKTDHDHVNVMLAGMADSIQSELARRYDPIFATTDAGPSPLDETGTVEALKGFRENAWRNAERLVNATSQAERDQVNGDIEQQSVGFAESIRAANTIPGYSATRDAHCRAHNPPSFRVRIRGRRLAGLLERGKVRLAIRSDGPARMRLGARLLGKRAGAHPSAAKGRALGLTRRRVVAVKGEGWHRFALELTSYGRRLLEGRPRARIRVALRVPRLSERRVKLLR